MSGERGTDCSRIWSNPFHTLALSEKPSQGEGMRSNTYLISAVGVLAALLLLATIPLDPRYAPPPLVPDPSDEPPGPEEPGPETPKQENVSTTANTRFATFASYRQLESYVLERVRQYRSFMPDLATGAPTSGLLGQRGLAEAQRAMEAGPSDQSGAATLSTFSKTNIQVAGVDELDIVKTDGSYLYIASQGRIYILAAYPPTQAQILSALDLGESSVEGLFIEGDRLAVIGVEQRFCVRYPCFPGVSLKLFDISDRSKPDRVKEVSLEGTYVSSRLTEGHI